MTDKNAKYRAESAKQLKEWLAGNSIHNHEGCTLDVVDEFGNIVGEHTIEGGECCPDFSCCGGEMWPLEQRKLFVDRPELRDEMCMMGLSGLIASQTPGVSAHIAGFKAAA